MFGALFAVLQQRLLLDRSCYGKITQGYFRNRVESNTAASGDIEIYQGKPDSSDGGKSAQRSFERLSGNFPNDSLQNAGKVRGNGND